MKNKYYLFTIEESVDGKEFIQKITSKSTNPNLSLKEIAKDWYEDDEDVEEIDGKYHFESGDIVVTPLGYQRLTKREFDILNKFGI